MSVVKALNLNGLLRAVELVVFCVVVHDACMGSLALHMLLVVSIVTVLVLLI